MWSFNPEEYHEKGSDRQRPSISSIGSGAMPTTITYAIELAVGLGCLAGVPAAWRGGRTRWLAGILLVAGLAAVLHAVLALAGR